jgi:hypothetical protein
MASFSSAFTILPSDFADSCATSLQSTPAGTGVTRHAGTVTLGLFPDDGRRDLEDARGEGLPAGDLGRGESVRRARCRGEGEGQHEQRPAELHRVSRAETRTASLREGSDAVGLGS